MSTALWGSSASLISFHFLTNGLNGPCNRNERGGMLAPIEGLTVLIIHLNYPLSWPLFPVDG